MHVAHQQTKTMNAEQIQAIAARHAEGVLGRKELVLAFMEAITEAIRLDRESDERLTDTSLFLPVDFVRKQNAVFEERIAGLQAERDDLAGWKREAITVESWWQKIAEFVRGHPEVPLGAITADTVLDWLKERSDARLILGKVAIDLSRVTTAIQMGTYTKENAAHSEAVLLEAQNFFEPK